MAADDAALVRRCLRGQPGAMRELIERFQSEVFGLSVRLLGNRHDAEDVVQETFLRVFRSLRRWDPNRPLRPWVLRIAVNRCRTWLSRRARRPEAADYLHDMPDRSGADDASELAAEIQRALTELRPEYQSVFILFHENGWSYDAIADVHNCPVGTVKTWLHRARLAILKRLRERGMVPIAHPDDSADVVT